MMLFIYNLVLLILLPLMVTRIIIKGLKDRDYLSNFINRFGLYRERGSINDDAYLNVIESVLGKQKIKMNKDKVVIENLKLLPDKYDDFRAKFIAPDNSLINMDVLRLSLIHI